MPDVEWWIVVRRGDINLATFNKAMVTPTVCPRLFEIFTTLTFGALANKETQRQRRLVVHVRSAICHEVSRTQPKLERKCVSVDVDAWALVS